MPKFNIKEFKSSVRTGAVGDLLVVSAEIKDTKTGGQYLSMLLSDGEQEIGARMWNTHDVLFGAGTVVCVVGNKEFFNDTVYIKVSNVGLGLTDKNEFIKHAPNSRSGLIGLITANVDMCTNSEMKKLTLSLLEDNKEQFLEVPAAVKHHHNYLEGTLQHTAEVLLDAATISINRIKLSKENIDLDLIRCGSALHDIGKVKCYSMNNGVPEMTTLGKFKDHLVVGSEMLNEKAIELGIDRNQEWFLKLDHIILSHHGKLEYGSPVAPCFPEARIVHLADMISFEMTSMFNSIDKIDGEWGTSRDYIFGSYLYAGNRDNV